MAAQVEINLEYVLDKIKGLSPTSELFAGKKFLEMMAKRKGVSYTIDFINRMLEVLDREEALNLAIDFNEDETKLFRLSRFNVYTRRNFLQTYAWVGCGAGFLLHGALEQAQNVAEYAGLENPQPAVQTTPLKSAIHFVGKHIVPPAEILCGAALMNEGYEKKLEFKLDQVARAITKMAEQVQKDYPERIRTP